MRALKIVNQRKVSDFLRAYFAPIVGLFILWDVFLLRTSSELLLGPKALFDPEPRNFLNMCFGRLSRSVGESPEFWFYVWIGLTVAAALGLFWKTSRTCAAAVSWVLLNTWIWSTGQTLYGVHRYIEISLMLIVFAAITADETVIWRWGKIFLCLTYFNTGWVKLMSPFWRNGDVIWTIHSYYFYTKWGFMTTASLVPFVPVFMLMSFVVILSQLMSPVLLFKPRWSPAWILVDCSIHLISAVMLKLYVFSGFLIFLNLAFLWSLPKNPRLPGNEAA